MGKKSFLLHLDSLDVLDKLPDALAGQLFKAIKHFQTHDELPEVDFALEIALIPFVNQFKRDHNKYENVIEKRREAGAKGGKQKVANATIAKQKIANVADNDSVNDSVSVSVSVNDNKKEKKDALTRKSILFDQFWEAYQKKTGREKCRKKWMTLSVELMDEIINKVPGYVKRTPDAQFRKDPFTWINAKGWEDELDLQKPNEVESISDPQNAGTVYYKSDCPGWATGAPFDYANYRRYKSGHSLKDFDNNLIPGSNVSVQP